MLEHTQPTESTPQKSALPQTNPHEEERQRLLAFKAMWKKSDHLAAEQVLKSMKTAHILETQVVLCDYILSPVLTPSLFGIPKTTGYFTRMAGKAVALELISASPRKEIIPLLLRILNHKEPAFAELASKTLMSFGKDIVPELVSQLSVNDHKRVVWTQEGYLRLITLVGKMKDNCATRTLLEAAQGVLITPLNRVIHPLTIISIATYLCLFFAIWEISYLKDINIEDSVFAGLMGTLTLAAPAVSLLAQKSLKKQRNQIQRTAIDALAQVCDKRVLLDLCYMLFWGKNPDRVAHTLFALLPTVNSQDTLLLRSTELRWLTASLSNSYPELPDFHLRVVQALEHLGNEESLPVVERLTTKGASESVRAEAKRILPVLRERASRQEERRNLLRASDVPAQEYNSLLRPAQATHEDSEQLLRPMNGEE